MHKFMQNAFKTLCPAHKNSEKNETQNVAASPMNELFGAFLPDSYDRFGISLGKFRNDYGKDFRLQRRATNTSKEEIKENTYKYSPD